MYNLIVLASRPSDWTHEQFIEWWRGEHAEVTYPLPGLLRWQHTELLDTPDERSAGRDGMSVLSFESRAALDAALASPEWEAAVRHVGEMRGRRMI
ncbi:MAG: EthD family reductase, partial [Nocardia sp.]|nr:EthD family reductase [Nocardia sp.]